MSRNWNFVVPRVEGIAPRQAHVGIPKGLWERELGRSGFSGAAVEFYHRNPPTAWSEVEGELRPHLLDTSLITEVVESPWDATELLCNADMRLRFWRTTKPMRHLVRNADGDELMFVHRGGGELFCDFGHITLSEGDYFAIPRGTSWRFEPAAETQMLLVEAKNGSYSLPDTTTTLGRHVPFDPGVFGVPSIDDVFKAQRRDCAWTILVKRTGRIFRLSYPFNPLDAEGWKGDLYPIRLNISDIRSVVSPRIHTVPATHATFVSERFVIVTFLPKPGETDPESCKLPSFHDNIDYDEVMFLHRGSKMPQRLSSFKEGMLTFHPAGLTHGPHPNTFAFLDTPEPIPLESTLIMIDTRNPLCLPDGGARCDVPGYDSSWAGSIAFAPDAKHLKD